ncbi:MAG: folate family ECF transporter S component [Eubacteriales bacterium]|jgi:ECF transporter S component (folate family)|nr:folate family ECF transporter S component [Clostridiales bacterium]
MADNSVRKLSKTPFSVRVLAQVSLLVALEIVLSRFLSINTQVVKIGFSFIPAVICAAAYGPLWAGVCAALGDLIGAILFPIGPFMPGITFTALLRGTAFGLAYYGLEVKPKSAFFWIRHAGVVVFNAVAFSLLLNSYWLSLLYTKGFVYFFTSRILQEAILIPIQIIINPLLLRFVWQMRKSGLIESEYVDEEAVSWRKLSASIILGCLLISLTVGFTGLIIHRSITDAAEKTAVLGDFLTDVEAADYLKITVEKLSELMQKGELDGTFAEFDGKLIFDRAALREWMAAKITAGAVD